MDKYLYRMLGALVLRREGELWLADALRERLQERGLGFANNRDLFDQARPFGWRPVLRNKTEAGPAGTWLVPEESWYREDWQDRLFLEAALPWIDLPQEVRLLRIEASESGFQEIVHWRLQQLGNQRWLDEWRGPLTWALQGSHFIEF